MGRRVEGGFRIGDLGLEIEEERFTIGDWGFTIGDWGGEIYDWGLGIGGRLLRRPAFYFSGGPM
jgi:hypothetical protein